MRWQGAAKHWLDAVATAHKTASHSFLPMGRCVRAGAGVEGCLMGATHGEGQHPQPAAHTGAVASGAVRDMARPSSGHNVDCLSVPRTNTYLASVLVSGDRNTPHAHMGAMPPLLAVTSSSWLSVSWVLPVGSLVWYCFCVRVCVFLL